MNVETCSSVDWWFCGFGDVLTGTSLFPHSDVAHGSPIESGTPRVSMSLLEGCT